MVLAIRRQEHQGRYEIMQPCPTCNGKVYGIVVDCNQLTTEIMQQFKKQGLIHFTGLEPEIVQCPDCKDK